MTKYRVKKEGLTHWHKGDTVEDVDGVTLKAEELVQMGYLEVVEEDGLVVDIQAILDSGYLKSTVEAGVIADYIRANVDKWFEIRPLEPGRDSPYKYEIVPKK